MNFDKGLFSRIVCLAVAVAAVVVLVLAPKNLRPAIDRGMATLFMIALAGYCWRRINRRL
jgi:hypothetical protein